jgi:hypothetical protein
VPLSSQYAIEEIVVRTFIVLVASFLYLAISGAAHAHGDDKPKQGGIMGRGDDSVSVELVMKDGVITLFVEEHANDVPIPTDLVKGWLNLSGPGRPAEEVKLVPAGDNKLTATGLKPRVGDRLRARMVLPSGEEVSSLFSFR